MEYIGGDFIPDNAFACNAVGKMLPSYRIAQASRSAPTIHKPTRVGALQPACLAMRDESLKLITEHVGGDLIPDNSSANNAVGKKLPSYTIAQASRCAPTGNVPLLRLESTSNQVARHLIYVCLYVSLSNNM